MTIDLLSLRAIVLSPEGDLREHFRQAASSLSVPVEIVGAVGAADARAAAAAGFDLAYIDTALHLEEFSRAVAALRTANRPPFTVQLAAGALAASFETDGLAGRPSRLEEAKWLLERSMRVRLPSRVLVVDDSSTMRSIVRKTLASTRFPLEVSEVDQGFAALELVREKEFHIVFLDYNMPDFSGLETLAEFKREQRRLSVVMMTSTPSAELADRARTLGAAFLKKPFFPADIEAVLSSFYGLRKLNPKRG